MYVFVGRGEVERWLGIVSFSKKSLDAKVVLSKYARFLAEALP